MAILRSAEATENALELTGVQFGGWEWALNLQVFNMCILRVPEMGL